MTILVDTSARKPAQMAVTVSVNGTTIACETIVREMQHHPAPKPIAAWQEAARALAVRELLLQRARHLGLTPTPICDDAGRRETNEGTLIRVLLEREVTVPKPDEDTCRRYYARNQSRFRSPDIFEASHILFAAVASDREAYAQARANAEAVLAALQKRSDSFAALAQAYSRCPSAAQGGNLGQITAGQTTPEFERALFALQPSSFSAEPVATPYGFHILRLDRKHEGQQLPFELVADRIAQYLQDRVRRRALAQYVARLASAARIEGIDLVSAEAMQVH